MTSFRACVGLLLLSAGTAGGSQAYWQQGVHYTMQVRLDTDAHQVAGSSHIVYTNNSPDSLRVIYLHLYPNAFKVGSVRHNEARQVYGTAGITADNPSGINITSLALTTSGSPVATAFKVDDTILEVALPSPLAPGSQTTVVMTWVHTLRKHTGRAGWRGTHYDLAQWYPKVAVYDESGWHIEPFHRIGEFYGNFGTFDVTVDVPYAYIVAATGVVTGGDPGWSQVAVDTSLSFDTWIGRHLMERDSLLAGKDDQRRVVTFHAEQVHDFAWLASPEFVYEGGDWGGTTVHVLYDRGVGRAWTKKVLRRSKLALEWLTLKVGPYAYPQITVAHGLLKGGMEYPMLAMNGHASAGVIIHEIAHVWFYGILGNNELEAAWLDEGFAEFQERWHLTDRYGPVGLPVEDRAEEAWQRNHLQTPILARDQWLAAAFQTGGHNEPVATAAYRSESENAYRVNAYRKASLMLESLKYLVGEADFELGMQNYYRQWALKHPTEFRFRREMELATGRELDWFFDQWLHTSGYLDYALTKWRQRPSSNGGYEVDVTLKRKGNWEAPVVVEVVTRSGQHVRETWTEFRHQTTGTLTLHSPEKVRHVILDPDDMLMDVDRRNNYSGMLPTVVAFKPRLAGYHPRNRYTLSYLPVLRYNTIDQLTPVIRLERRYGFGSLASTMRLDVGYGLGSGHWDWYFRHAAPVFKHDTRTAYQLEAFRRDGLTGGGVTLERNWSRVYNVKPIYTMRFNLATVNAHNTNYAPSLFDKGRVTSATTTLAVRRQTMDWHYDYAFTAAAGAPTVGDFDFSRATFELHAARALSGWQIKFRFLAGSSWSSGDIPNQERFTIAAAGSMDTYNRTYLSAEGALAGLGSDIQGRYHLPGDANLRGYYDAGYFGVHSLLTSTLEVSRSLQFKGLGEFGGRLFLDAGQLWGHRFSSAPSDRGFDGDLLADAGLGLDWTRQFLGQSLYFRVDFPFVRLADASGEVADGTSQLDVDFSRWVFSFQRGL
ncbi:MAG: BamA/TamA family outer membrane protein [Candidatus Marinimicrobia bacterium]|nr:BamA/TamA family outer membrane protein [Candidatus Neomarinimicrobiota bacterium]